MKINCALTKEDFILAKSVELNGKHLHLFVQSKSDDVLLDEQGARALVASVNQWLETGELK